MTYFHRLHDVGSRGGRAAIDGNRLQRLHHAPEQRRPQVLDRGHCAQEVKKEQ